MASLRSERGTELLEFALVLPILLLVLAGILDMGFLFKDYEVLTNAAREGARMASLPGWVAADVQARVDSYLLSGGFQGAATTRVIDVVIADGNGRTINGVQVVVSAPHTYFILGPIAQLIQGVPIGNPTLTAAVTMRSEVAAGL